MNESDAVTQPLTEIPNIREQSRSVKQVVFPPATGWFTAERVEYLKNFFQMLFMALAFPYLFLRFFRNPFDTIKVVGKAQVGTA